MAAKKKAKQEPVQDTVETSKPDVSKLPSVMKISELQKLTEAEKQAFRASGGTSTEG